MIPVPTDKCFCTGAAATAHVNTWLIDQVQLVIRLKCVAKMGDQRVAALMCRIKGGGVHACILFGSASVTTGAVGNA